MAKIEQNGYYSPPLGTPKTTQGGCIAARFLSVAAIADDSPDNAGTTLTTRGREQVTELGPSGTPVAP